MLVRLAGCVGVSVPHLGLYGLCHRLQYPRDLSLVYGAILQNSSDQGGLVGVHGQARIRDLQLQRNPIDDRQNSPLFQGHNNESHGLSRVAQIEGRLDSIEIWHDAGHLEGLYLDLRRRILGLSLFSTAHCQHHHDADHRGDHETQHADEHRSRWANPSRDRLRLGCRCGCRRVYGDRSILANGDEFAREIELGHDVVLPGEIVLLDVDR